MISAFDKFTEDHPRTAAFLKERIRLLFAAGSAENIACCFFSAFALGCIRLNADGIFVFIASVITVMVWLCALTAGGFMRQWTLMFFTVLFFAFPFGVSDMTGGVGELFRSLAETTSLGMARMISDITGIDELISSGAALLICAVFFAVGAYIRSAAKSSDFYCRTRIEQMS